MKYDDLIRELLELPTRIAECEESAAAARIILDNEESILLTSGEITGKNEAERKAQVLLRTEQVRRALAGRTVELHERQNRFAALRSVARLLSAQDAGE